MTFIIWVLIEDMMILIFYVLILINAVSFSKQVLNVIICTIQEFHQALIY